MERKDSHISAEKLEAYEKLVETIPEIECKGKKVPYTSVNGHMFSTLSGGDMGLRLSKEEREAFIDKFKTTLYESYGAVMKEYVAVPDDLLFRTEKLKPYFEMSYEYTKNLKPKPAKNSKK